MARGIDITPLQGQVPLPLMDRTLDWYAVINQLKTGSGINTDAIISTLIAAGNVQTSHLANDAVTGAKIVDDAISTDHVLADNITGAKIVDDAITTDHILADNVTGAKVVDDAITTGHILADAVTGAKIVDDAITTDHILADNVTGAKIVDDAITTDHILADAVTGAKIVDASITGAHILDGQLYAGAYFVVEGCKINTNGGTQALSNAAGAICAGGTWVSVAGGSLPGMGYSAGAATWHDLVVALGNGTITYVRGTTVVPSCPATAVVLATIAQAGNNTNISVGDLDNSPRFALSRV